MKKESADLFRDAEAAFVTRRLRLIKIQRVPKADRLRRGTGGYSSSNVMEIRNCWHPRSIFIEGFQCFPAGLRT